MNLDQLALQCYEECGDYHLGSVPQFNHKKFAELVVLECIQTIDSSTPVYSDEDLGEDYCRGMLMGYTSAIIDVKKHFGVK